MLDNPPAESEKQSWGYVALAVLVIFGTIPVARALREAVDARVGNEAFLYVCVALLLAAAGGAVATLRRRRMTGGAYIGLAAVLGLFAALIYSLRAIPEEAFHVAEYGVLGLLVYRALIHRVRDYSVYVATTLVVGMIGLLDEYVQWVTPTRYFDLRDVGTNLIAGLLSQAAIAVGLRPRLACAKPSRASVGRLCYLGAVALLLVAFGFVNTPPRIAWYASNIPGLAFLLDSRSMMAEYGYLHESDVAGQFSSRFSIEELRRLDRERGTEVGLIPDRYRNRDEYADFLIRYSVPRDPYVHEFGVHLFRREVHLHRARQKTTGQGEHYRIALHENRILEQYFARALHSSSRAWDEAVKQEVGENATGGDYLSPVSRNIITRIREWQLLCLFGLAIALLCWFGYRLGGGAAQSPAGPQR